MTREAPLVGWIGHGAVFVTSQARAAAAAVNLGFRRASSAVWDRGCKRSRTNLLARTQFRATPFRKAVR
jgi:hypothetical protein